MSDLNSLLDQSSYLRLMSNTLKHKERTTSSNVMSKKQEYISCIRIKGRPILPPVMTPERKLECIEWKRKALEVEEKIGLKRREKILAAIRSLNLNTSSASTNHNSRPCSAPIPNNDNENERNNPLDMGDNNSKTELQQVNNKENLIDEKPDLMPEENALNAASGSKEQDELILQSTKFSEEKIENNTPNINEYETQAHMDNYMTNSMIDPKSNEENIIEEATISESTPNSNSVHNRERRGSYTLEEPSPLLLAYMERFGQDFKEKNNSMKSKYLTYC